ncbi:MAG: FAD-binding oxidoreductase [Candidatus Nanopelagicales bacterium]
MSFDDQIARWGVPPEPIKLKAGMVAFLNERVGKLHPSPQAGRTNVEVPDSRISEGVLSEFQSALSAESVTTDADARLAHSGGFSYLDIVARRGVEPKVADAVIFPTSKEDVVKLLALAEQYRLAVVPFGGGTSVVGGVRADAEVSENSDGFNGILAVAFDKFADLVGINDVDMTVTVQPGMTGPALERLLNPRGLTLGHFPQSWERASIGGYAATRSSGQASSGYGRSNEMIESLTVVTPRGEFDLGIAPGTAAGPDLRQVFIGSEGAFGFITSITLRIRRLPEVTRYEGIMFPTYESALAAFRELKQAQVKTAVLRLSDPQETATNLTMAVEGRTATALNKYLEVRKVAGGCLAIVSWEGTSAQVKADRSQTWTVFKKHRGVSLGRKVGDGWEHARYSGPYLRDVLMDQGLLVETLETATRWSNMENLRNRVYQALTDSLRAGNPDAPGPHIMSHLSHVYDTGGSLYVTVVAEVEADDPVGQWERAKQAACQAIVEAGATITHHHAVGRDHAPFLAEEIGESGVELLRSIKAQVDPAGIMNPGVLVS